MDTTAKEITRPASRTSLLPKVARTHPAIVTSVPTQGANLSPQGDLSENSAHIRVVVRESEIQSCQRTTLKPSRQKLGWRRRQLKALYGLSMSGYESMLRAQNGVCQICKRKPEGYLQVDHCHSTGKVRGLLCGNCNSGIGLLQESREVLASAIKYLTPEA